MALEPEVVGRVIEQPIFFAESSQIEFRVDEHIADIRIRIEAHSEFAEVGIEVTVRQKARRGAVKIEVLCFLGDARSSRSHFPLSARLHRSCGVLLGCGSLRERRRLRVRARIIGDSAGFHRLRLELRDGAL